MIKLIDITAPKNSLLKPRASSPADFAEAVDVAELLGVAFAVWFDGTITLATFPMMQSFPLQSFGFICGVQASIGPF